MKRVIDKVIDNKDKQNTYRELNKRRNEALKSKKYVEVIAYDYAMIEDRLLSILKHIDLIELNDYKYNINKEIKDEFCLLYYNDDKNHDLPHINMMNTKIKIIKKILKYQLDNTLLINMSNILKIIDDNYELNKSLRKVKKWCDKRNEIVHAMYNKNVIDFDKKIEDIAIEGKDLSYLFSRICNEIKKIKNGYGNK